MLSSASVSTGPPLPSPRWLGPGPPTFPPQTLVHTCAWRQPSSALVSGPASTNLTGFKRFSTRAAGDQENASGLNPVRTLVAVRPATTAGVAVRVALEPVMVSVVNHRSIRSAEVQNLDIPEASWVAHISILAQR